MQPAIIKLKIYQDYFQRYIGKEYPEKTINKKLFTSFIEKQEIKTNESQISRLGDSIQLKFIAYCLMDLEKALIFLDFNKKRISLKVTKINNSNYYLIVPNDIDENNLVKIDNLLFNVENIKFDSIDLYINYFIFNDINLNEKLKPLTSLSLFTGKIKNCIEEKVPQKTERLQCYNINFENLSEHEYLKVDSIRYIKIIFSDVKTKNKLKRYDLVLNNFSENTYNTDVLKYLNKYYCNVESNDNEIILMTDFVKNDLYENSLGTSLLFRYIGYNVLLNLKLIFDVPLDSDNFEIYIGYTNEYLSNRFSHF